MGFQFCTHFNILWGWVFYLHFLGWSAVLGLWHLVRFATGPSYCHLLAWLEEWNCMVFQFEIWVYIHLIWWVLFAGIVSNLNAVAVCPFGLKGIFARFGTLLHTCHLYHHLCLKYTFASDTSGDLFTFIACFRYLFWTVYNKFCWMSLGASFCLTLFYYSIAVSVCFCFVIIILLVAILLLFMVCEYAHLVPSSHHHEIATAVLLLIMNASMPFYYVLLLLITEYLTNCYLYIFVA